MPALTVLLPTYNRGDLLASAVESVRAQAYEDFQLLILDNCSTDSTAAVAEAFRRSDPRVRYIRHSRNMGALANFQNGMRRVDTEFFAFLSDDDTLLPECYSVAIATAERDPAAAMVSCRMMIRTPDGRVRLERSAVGAFDPPTGLLEMLRRGHVTWTGTVFRREVIAEVGDLDQASDPVFDLDFQYRVAAIRRVVLLEHPGAVFTARARTASTGLDWLPLEIAAAERVIAKTPDQETRNELRSALSRRVRRRSFSLVLAAALEGEQSHARTLARQPVAANAVLWLVSRACRNGRVRRALQAGRVRLRPSVRPAAPGPTGR